MTRFVRLLVLATLMTGVTVVTGSTACVVGTRGQEPTTPQPAPQPVYVAQPQPVMQPQPVAVAQPVMQPQPTVQPVLQPQASAQAVMQPAVTATSTTSNFGSVTLSPEFLPDPRTSEGRSGGSQNAQSWSSNCRGWVSATPDHLIVTSTPFNNLRVLAASSDDITLVVRGPDGAYRCNDDAEGNNPIVSGHFAAGTHAVWVGSYRQGVIAPYRIGFSELASVTTASLTGGAVQAAPPPTTQIASNFGTFSLATGFTPDPHVVQGTSGGSVNAQGWNSSCRGWVSQTPDHVLVATTPFSSLRVIGASDQDVTLVIQRPDGSYSCNDDTEGRNPIISGRFASGAYRIWLGSYNQGVRAPYRLGLTELSSVTAASLGGGAVSSNSGLVETTGGSANFGTLRLRTGFTPDPYVTNGTSGGSVNAQTINASCNGWIASRPDHIFVAQSAFNNLRILVRSSSDTTLVVRQPDGSFRCNDDTEGTHPVVGGSFQPGSYRIWVGSYREGENADYSLGLTELSSVSTGSLPAR